MKRAFLKTIFLWLTVATVHAQDLFNIPVVQETGVQGTVRVVASDPAGGYLIFWIDGRSGRGEIFGQFLDIDGYPLLPQPESLFALPGSVIALDGIADGEGGAYVAWVERRGQTSAAFITRVSPDGALFWEPLPLGGNGGFPVNIRLRPDLQNGVYAVWDAIQPSGDGGIAIDSDIYAQHLDAGGAKLWQEGGVAVIAANGLQTIADAAEMAKGLAVTWQERTGVLVQILDFDTGLPVSDAPLRPSLLSLGQSHPRLAGRIGSTDVYVVWQDGDNIRAQRFSASGERLWGAAGVPVIRASGVQGNHAVMSDENGQLIVVWEDSRESGTGIDLRAQKLNKRGDPQWNRAGVVVNSAAGDQKNPRILSDRSRGLICVWEDFRSGEADLYAQRLNRSGNLQWTDTGVAVSTWSGAQQNARIALHPQGKLMIAWEDLRNNDSDIFAQQLLGDGTPDNVAPIFISEPVDTAAVGADYVYAPVVEDIDRDLPLEIVPSLLPTWLEWDAAAGVLSGRVPNLPGQSAAVALEVIDARGGQSKQAFEIFIVGENHPPRFTSIPDTLAWEDSLYVYNIRFEDPDPNDTHRLVAEQLPGWLTLDEQRQTLSGTPRNQHVGEHPVRLSVIDQAHGSDTQQFVIHVINTNDPPQFEAEALADTAWEDQPYQRVIEAVDPDSGDSIEYHFLFAPHWLQLDAASGLLTGTPTNSEVGDTLAQIVALDRENAADTLNLLLHIQNTNDPPFFVSVPETLAVVDSMYSYLVIVADVDPGDRLTVSYDEGPEWLAFEENQNLLSGIPPESAVEQRFPVRLTVHDLAGADSTQSFFVHVVATAIPDSTPPASPTAAVLLPEGWTPRDTLELRFAPPADESGVKTVFGKFAQPPATANDFDFQSRVAQRQDSLAAAQIPALAEGRIDLYIWLGDRAGNADFHTAVPVPYRVDRTPPAAPVLLHPLDWSRGDTLRFLWLAAQDTVSGVAEYLIKIDPGDIVLTVADFSPQQDTLAAQFVLNLEDKNFQWQVAASDSAGNQVESIVRSFSIDNVPPLILHSPIDTVQSGQPVTISARVSDLPSGLIAIDLLYRFPGASTYSAAQMLGGENQIYSAQIPAFAVDAVGVEYTIRARDLAGNVSYWKAQDQLNAFRSLVVVSNGMPLPRQVNPERYQMISFPLQPEVRDPLSFFEKQLGTYDDNQWRLLRYQSGKYVELTRGDVDSLAPGRAYWLITRTSVQLQSGPATSVRSDRPFRLTLLPGWNMVATPFPFATNFDPADLPPGVEPVLWRFDGQGYVMEQTRLQPWEGYFLKNQSDVVVTWEIQPQASPPARRSAAWAGNEWTARLELSQGNGADGDNFFGVASEDAPDSRRAWSEPPAIGDSPSLYFLHAGEKLAAQWRLPAEVPPAWEVEIQNLSRGTAEIRIRRVLGPTDSLRFRLTDLQTGVSTILAFDEPWRFWHDGSALARRFRLQPLSAPQHETALPERAELYPLSPNPFARRNHTGVVVRFALHEPARAAISVYDLLGREVWRMPAVAFSAGEHAVIWPGVTSSRSPAPAGIYFVQLQLPDRRLVRKLLVLK